MQTMEMHIITIVCIGFAAFIQLGEAVLITYHNTASDK